MPSPTQIVRFIYTNHRGEKAERRVLPIRVWFGRTDYHPIEQWLLHAFDVEKLAPRDFAMLDVSGWHVDRPPRGFIADERYCDKTYVDEQGLSRPCTRMEGCGLRGCAFKP